MDALPHWPQGTVAVLSTGAGAPHAMPVSACVRRSDRVIALGLALRRESLARLRSDPQCALTVFAPGLAFTASGRAAVEHELERIAVVRVDVERLQDHTNPRYEIDAGVAWHWTSAEAEQADAETRAALT